MLKARQKAQIAQLKYPEPREGLPEDPRPFIGSHHLVAAASVQEQLSARCLVAVVGRLGSGKSTVCRRAANSRWARQWFLQDENGHPVHRRFWVDLEDCHPGAETEERIAQVLGRPTFEQALGRLSNGRPGLLILDNADHAFGEADDRGTLTELVNTVDRGASIVVSRRSLSGLNVDRAWNDIVEVPGFGSHDEAKQLFDQLAPQHRADLRSAAIVATCDRLPLAVSLLGHAAAGADLEQARLRTGVGPEGPSPLEFALEVTTAMVDPEDRLLWAGLSLFPSGLSAEDIDAVFPALADARQQTMQLYASGVLRRGEAGVRVPGPLRLAPGTAHLHRQAVSDLWRDYVKRAQAVIGPLPPAVAAGGKGAGGPDGGGGTGQRGGSGRRDRAARANPDSADGNDAADTWLQRQRATVGRLVIQAVLPDEAFDLACTGLLLHHSAVAPDSLDTALARLVERSLADESPSTPDASVGYRPLAEPGAPPDHGSQGGDALSPGAARAAVAARLAAALEERRRFGTSVLIAEAVAVAQRQWGDMRREAEARCQQGRSERLCARYEDAELHLGQAHQNYEELDDGVGQGNALFELGLVALDRGRLDDAEVYLEEGLGLFAANGRPVGEANTNLELVRVDLARGRHESAERRLAEAMDRYERAGDSLGFANASLQLGQLELARGQFDSAERRFGGALDGYEQAADKVGFAHACLQLGQVELHRGRLGPAERRFGAALVGYEVVGDKVGLANAALQLGQIDLARGGWAQAAPRLLQALDAYEQLGDRIGVANASLQLGQADLGLGELDEADRRLSAAQWAYDDVGDVAGSANSRHVRAILRHAQGDRTDALALFGEAARLYGSIGRLAAAASSLAAAARICTGKAERMGYAADAVRRLEQAGQAAAATKLARELAEPPAKPVPEPVVKRMQWRLRVADALSQLEPLFPPASDPWPRILPPQGVAEESPEVTAAEPLDLDEGAGSAPPEGPKLEWSPQWSGTFEEIEAAPLGEWTPEPAPQVAAPPDAEVTVGAWSPRDWREDPPAEPVIGGWSPGKWSEDDEELPAPVPELIAGLPEPLSIPQPADTDAASVLFAREGAGADEAWPEVPSRKPRFRWGRRGRKQDDTDEYRPGPPTLPGMEP